METEGEKYSKEWLVFKYKVQNSDILHSPLRVPSTPMQISFSGVQASMCQIKGLSWMTHLCREEMVLQYRLPMTSQTSQNS